MSTNQSKIGELIIEGSSQLGADTIYCCLDAESWWTCRLVLAGERLLAAQALQLLMTLDGD